MFYNYFINDLTEEEHAFLFGYVYSIILKTCNFECTTDYIKFLKPLNTKTYIEKMKPKLLPEKQYVADNLIQKIEKYIKEL